jgi:pimeloyl-ACP methyl ester carboxylesterase
VDERADVARPSAPEPTSGVSDPGTTPLLEVIAQRGGTLTHCDPAGDRYVVAFGDPGAVDHVAVFVPGVGDDSNLRDDWIGWALSLRDAAEDSAVVLWKAYDDPPDLAAAAIAALACDTRADCAGRDLAAFVADLAVGTKTLTVIAHSFGTLVVSAALADHALCCTSVVVLGSPGMSVETVAALHLEAQQFFAERAPDDPVADLALLGVDPASRFFGGTWLATNAPGAPTVRGHSAYFSPGSQSLANLAAIVTGRPADAVRHRLTPGEVVGGLVVEAMTLPLRPLEQFTRHYRGPGFRALDNLARAARLAATETGALLGDAVDRLERAVEATVSPP